MKNVDDQTLGGQAASTYHSLFIYDYPLSSFSIQAEIELHKQVLERNQKEHDRELQAKKDQIVGDRKRAIDLHEEKEKELYREHEAQALQETLRAKVLAARKQANEEDEKLLQKMKEEHVEEEEQKKKEGEVLERQSLEIDHQLQEAVELHDRMLHKMQQDTRYVGLCLIVPSLLPPLALCSSFLFLTV